MSGVTGRSGRKPITITSEKGRKALLRMLPLAIEAIRTQLKPREKDLICPHCGAVAATESEWCQDKLLPMYVVDQVLGKARISIDTKVSGEVTVSADELATILLGLRIQESAILAKYNLSPALQLAAAEPTETIEAEFTEGL